MNLTRAEQQKILRWSRGVKTRYPRDKSIPQIFEEVAKKQGKKIALRSVEGTMSYAELNAKANQLARSLQKQGVKKGDFVGVSMGRSINLIVSLLAILKAGGVYVPLDPSYPEERKQFMIKDAGLKIILTKDNLRFDPNRSNPKVKVGPLDLAYINYTSGSTGKPKGVEIPHRGVVRLVKNTNWIKISKNDRFSHISNISFDAATFEIWGALLNGATLCIFSTGTLGKFLIQEKITILDIPSRLFALMVDEEIDSLKHMRVICPGGDVLSAHHARIALKALPHCKIINTYGPTENTTNTTAYLLKEPIERDVPIGKPISNTSVYILDPNLQLVPIGTPGEICTGGDGLARGYLHRDDLTREKWIQNPFGEGLLYRTGDLGMFLPNGEISYLGRIDSQVKVRGFRIELGEIEEVIRTHPQVTDCVVIVREDHPGNKQIAAYVVWKKEADLRSFLEKKLPAYMIPTFFVALNKLPIDPNGKVDRKALPPPIARQTPKPMQNDVAALWAKVLHVDHVGPEDHFFKLGGDSILAMEMISRLKKELKIEISIEKLFQFPVLADFLAQEETATQEIPRRNGKGPIPLSFNQESLWLVNQAMPESSNYSLLFDFDWKGELDIPRFKRAIEEIARRHEILRTRFTEEGMQIIEPEVKEFFHDARIETPFHLNQTPLFRVHLTRVAPDHHLAHFNFHHIVFDGWSAGVFFKELTELYAGKKLPELPIQYADFAVWQRTRPIKTEYWKEKLKDLPDLLELPWDHPRPPQFSGKEDVEKRQLPKALAKELMDLARSKGVTLFVLLMSAFKVLLHRYSGQDDFAIGTPYANRNGYPLDGMIGFFVQIFVIRSKFSAGLSFDGFLEQTNQTLLEAFQQGDVPFERLVSEINPARSPSSNPLFQVSFSMEKENFDLHNHTAKFDLTLTIREGDTFECCMEYCTDLFERETIQRMLHHFEVLLTNIVKHPSGKIELYPLLTAQELKQITVEWNQTKTAYPRDRSICSLFEEIVEQHPKRTALRFEGKAMSYQELNRRANQVARHLLHLGVQSREFVGVSLERSIDLIVAILAILKAGGVYVPIDASYPKERKQFMIEDASLKVILTDLKPIKNFDSSNIQLSIDPLDLAYINYTSGSTGKPKGVQVTHRGVVRLVRNINWNKISIDDRFLQISNVSFDAFTHEMWGALLNGATLCIFPQKNFSTDAIGKFLVEEKITQVLFTARLFNLMVDEQLESLKGLRVLCSCGEAMSPRHAKKAVESLPETCIKNTCGHTENTTHTVTYDIKKDSRIEHNVPIGKPISNTTVYILDKYLQPVPIGVHGELYTGGDGVANGYLNREELTQEKFIPNCFGEGELYRTGDLVRYLPDGNIAFIGRIDNQVKVRGFRIELGEIEEVLRQYGPVADSVVLFNNEQLIAYIEPEKGKKISVEEISDYAQSKLPQFMLPHFFMVLKKFPQSPNGKVDRKALPPYKLQRRAVSYKTKTEKAVASMWSQLLHIPRIAPDDQFFKLGGDSIHAMRLISEIKKKFHIEASIRAVFQHPTLSDLAKWVDLQEKSDVNIPKRKIHTPVPLSLNQEALWLLEKFYPGAGLYMIAYAFRFESKIDLKKSMQKVVARHEILRTRFVEKNGKVWQKIEKKCPDAFIELKMSEKEGLEFIQRKGNEGMDLARLPLLQVHAIKIGPHSYLGLLRVHHIIFDGWSTGVFFREWLSQKRPSSLPVQYGDFAVWQRAFLETDAAKKQMEYWKRKLNDAPECLPLPLDKPRPSRFSGKGAEVTLEISEALNRALIDLARKEGITRFVLCMAAFNVLLSRYTGKTDILIGTPFANRKIQHLEPLIGFFVRMFVIRSSLHGRFDEFVQQVNKTLIEAYHNGEIPFEKVVEIVNPTRNPSFNPIFQVGFEEEEGIHLKEIPLERKVSEFDLNLSMIQRKLVLEYSTDLFEKKTVQRMLSNFETLLKGIVVNPRESIFSLPILSPEEKHQVLVEWNQTQRAYPKDKSIPTLFEQIAREQPEHVALRMKGHTLSYQKLNEQANQLAHSLREQGVAKGDFVGVTLERGFELIIALLAILKVGAAYVPIDGTYPKERREFMIKDAGLRVHVTPAFFPLKDSSKKNLGIEVGPLDSAYVNFTSGSTGKPKGVDILHRGVIRQSIHSGFFECTPQDRVLNMANISFDATTTEIWNTLLNGATLCIWPQQEFLAEELGKFLIEEKITHALLTARIFNLMIEQQLSSLKNLKYLVSGGEAMSPYHAKLGFESLPHTQIVNAYGPTENTVCTTIYSISDLNAIEGRIPIGRPIANTQVYLLDSHQQPVPLGAEGELYTGGDGLAKGYLNRAELTAEKFIPNPFGPGKLYRTGDLAKYLPDGNLIYLGRNDQQVKIRGFRIELGEIEEVLRKHPNVSDCIALLKEKQLVAYIESKEKLSHLSDFCSNHLPKYMIPSFFIILDKFPLTPNGKIDRKALPSPLQTLEARAFEPPQTPTEKIISDTWSALLKVPKIGRQDDFFQLGGHSITAAQLSSLVTKEFGIHVPVGLIFEHSTLAAYAKRIESLIEGKDQILTRETFTIWRDREAVLDPSIDPTGPLPRPSQYERPKNIFLTGATGFVGVFFLKELIEKTKAKIYCHVRGKNQKEGLSRLKQVMQKYLIWKAEYSSRIVIVPGDLEQELLGIEPKQFELLSEKIDSIFHIGAHVNHVLPYSRLKAANVDGTEEALRLACKTRMKPFHLISTVAVVAIESTHPIEEDIDLQDCKELFNGYAESKWVAEKLVLIARSRGLPANIYRLARVSGDSRSGSGPTGDFLWRVVQASIRLKLAFNLDYREDLTPVDYICSALREISTKPQEINKQFHLIDQQICRYKDLFKLLQQLGYPLKMTGFETWRKQLIETAIKTGESDLQALMPLFSEIDLSKEKPLLLRCDHLTHALKGTSIRCTRIGEKIFTKYIDYLVKIGFLPKRKKK